MENLKTFCKNLKAYFKYLMGVGFGELFRNVGVLICIILLSFCVYFPIQIVQELIRSFIAIWGGLDGIAANIYNFVFSLISAICAIYVFIWLCNLRFADLEEFKKQINLNTKTSKNKDKTGSLEKEDEEEKLTKEVKEESKEEKVNVDTKEKEESKKVKEEDVIELPKAKNSK